MAVEAVGCQLLPQIFDVLIDAGHLLYAKSSAMLGMVWERLEKWYKNSEASRLQQKILKVKHAVMRTCVYVYI